MERIEHCYRPYIWCPERGKYIYLHPIRRSTLEDCKASVELARKDKYSFSHCDWSKIQYRYTRITYSEEIIVNE